MKACELDILAKDESLVNDEFLTTRIFWYRTILMMSFDEKKPIKRTADLVKTAANCGLEAGKHYKQIHQLYDLAEATLNEYIGNKDIPKYPKNAMTFLQSYADLLPTFTERSSDKSLFQQFSTPLHISWLLVQLANIKVDEWVLEPSAGTGAISCLLKQSLANRIIVNEIHPFRHWLLTEQAYHNIFREDAIQLHNMPEFRNLVPDKIIMNPPFSRSVQTKAKVDVLAGAKHVVSSYKLLKPGGRLVLLINDSFNHGSKAFSFFQEHAEKHHVVMNASLDPETFKQKGTHFKTRILIIDKSPEKRFHIPFTEINDGNINDIIEQNFYNQ